MILLVACTDNELQRAGECYVEVCNSSKEAEKLLKDGEELLAA